MYVYIYVIYIYTYVHFGCANKSVCTALWSVYKALVSVHKAFYSHSVYQAHVAVYRAFWLREIMLFIGKPKGRSRMISNMAF